MRFFNSTHNFYKKNKDINSQEILDKYNKKNEIDSLEVIKNEEFGFFVTFNIDCESYISVMENYDLPWWGLSNRYRIDAENVIGAELNIVDYVIDDDGVEKADILLREKSKVFQGGEVVLYLCGKVPSNYNKDHLKINFKLYKSNGYEKEELIDNKIFSIDVIDFVLDNKIDDSFFLDLWQHPCSWARTYGVEYFSESHFEIIEKYLLEMSKLGQKVINLVVSDFPWAGQKCFDIIENKSRLYEYNIIGIKKIDEKFIFDFSSLDRYIDICLKVGIKDEINLFGIIGNWHGFDFGSPLEDYSDPIRLKYYDVDNKIYDYIRKKEDLKEYLRALFEHLKNKNLLSITKIIGDEPSDTERFKQFSDFLNSTTDHELKYKYAIHSPGFLDAYDGDVESFSINTLLMADYYEDGTIKGKLGECKEKMTWYSCCFPQKFNVFIKSPLIETRYMGLYTYLWKMKGMLRWAYGIYVENIYSRVSYKPEKWSAGDMFFVYPGKNGEVVHSLREKNLLYGIQDFNIFRTLEKIDVNIYNKLKKKLDIDVSIEENNGDIILDEYKTVNDYVEVRNSIIKSTIRKNKGVN